MIAWFVYVTSPQHAITSSLLHLAEKNRFDGAECTLQSLYPLEGTTRSEASLHKVTESWESRTKYSSSPYGRHFG